MNDSTNVPARRTFLYGIVALPIAAAASAAAPAQGSKASKDSMHYQTAPNGSMQCSGCKFFIPAQDAAADGTCQIVDGSISPHGYCMAYNAKS